VLNVAVALVALACTLPLMLVIAALIKLTSRGPVLFTQTRVGLDRRALSRAGGNTRRHTDLGGKPFTIYKFRTMQVQQSRGREVWASQDDPRITPIGRLLRRLRLDELPQFFNVLKGDMNIVGPRPEQPAIFVYLREQIEGYQRRQRVRPGITGWAQVNGLRGETATLDRMQARIEYDLDYLRHWSLHLDLWIVLRTVLVVLNDRQAC
jgi:putative colanic acid biosynthesis UDP-glucose lipid carrier transferase